jgi:ribonuclease BN (tRNA processing enzyme)
VSARLAVLGAGSILPRVDYGCSGYALCPAPGAPVTLLDCGPGSVRMLARVGIALEDVRRVVLSHFHTDHCLDLFALFFARRNPSFERVPPLELVGPSGLGELVERGGEALRRHPRDPDARVVEVAPGGTHAAGGLVFECAPTGHTSEALAWRVTCPGGEVLCYSGDSGEAPALAELARGADLFVCECSFPDAREVPHHLTPSSAARLAAKAGARTLLLSHFYPGHEPEEARAVALRAFDGAIELARDGSVHALR